MIDIIKDIELIENVLMALKEGASDEKRMAVYTLENLIERKEAQVAAFEAQINEDGYACSQVA